MHTETITYFDKDARCLGFLAYDDQIETKRPAVLVAPAWRGQDDFAREKAIELARLGYIGFAADIYGEGRCVSNEEAPKLMKPFFLNRKLLQGRIGAAVHCVKELSKVNGQKIGAIGFCFGGLTVYELLRSDIEVKGVVSFHGVFATEREGIKADMVPLNNIAKKSLLILHGHDDPMVSDEDLKNVMDEMSQASVDWQLVIFGHTMHAFTNPVANQPDLGKAYNEVSSLRAWHAMVDFFEEIFA